MSSRLSKLIRNLSVSEKKRTESPVPYAYCDVRSHESSVSTTDSQSVGGSRTNSLSLTSWTRGDMNVLQKAVQHGKDKDLKHKDDKKAKEKLKGHNAGKTASRPGAPKAASLSIDMESPPLVMFGTINGSSGALMSGQLKLKVNDPEVRLDTLQLELVVEQTNKKPVEKACAECAKKTTVLKTWKLAAETTTYKAGEHQFPFSYLLDGHLPASTDTPLGSIAYVLSGKALEAPRSSSVSSAGSTSGDHHHSHHQAGTSDDLEITIRHPLSVYRAIQPPETDRTAVRVFPPTNLQAMCTLPPLIHPITNGFPVLLRLSGVSEHADRGKTVRTWRLKKLTWRLEEHSIVVSQACDKHSTKVGGKGKGVKHEHVVTLGGKELREGWKSDYAPPSLKQADAANNSSGTVEIELACGPNPRRHDDVRPACDVETPSGFSVRHKLVIECVVTEELHPTDKPKWVAPTGVARILRMGFEIRVTERTGLGISWDEEQPPVYEDVPESPPGYLRSDGPPLGDDTMELGPSGRAVPRREDSPPFEPPPSYAENRLAIADDEEWDVHHVDLSEGVRPSSGTSDPRSRSRDFTPAGVTGSAGPSGWRSPNARPRLDASDLDIDPLGDMMRGRQMSEDRRATDDIGRRDD